MMTSSGQGAPDFPLRKQGSGKTGDKYTPDSKPDKQSGVGGPSKTCPDCHAKVPNAAVVCPTCGHRLVKS